MYRIASAFLFTLIFQAGISEACVTVQRTAMSNRFVNGCPYAVIVRYQENGHGSQTGVISSGRYASVYAIDGPYSWCNVGNNSHWICN